MATTFQNIYEAVQNRLQLDTSNTTELTIIKEYINDRYKDIIGVKDWPFLYEKTTLVTTAEYTTGSVDCTEGSTTVTGNSTVFTSAMTGRKIKVAGHDEIYTVTYVSATELTLDNEYNGDDTSEATYTIFQDEISLPSDCEFVLVLRQHMSPIALKLVGLRDMRRRHPSSYPQNIDPDEYAIYEPDASGYTKILLHPAPYRQIVLDSDYKKTITDLSAAGDEPVIPENYRQLLKLGAMADMYGYLDDKRRFSLEKKYKVLLKDMIDNYAKSDDNPQLVPENRQFNNIDPQALCDNYSLGWDIFRKI